MLTLSFRWRRARSLLALGGYVLACVGLSLPFGVVLHAAMILFCWVALVLVCISTDRGDWSIGRRIGFAVILWLATVWPPVLLQGLGVRVGNVAFLAMSALVILVAMRRSRLFVEPVHHRTWDKVAGLDR